MPNYKKKENERIADVKNCECTRGGKMGGWTMSENCQKYGRKEHGMMARMDDV